MSNNQIMNNQQQFRQLIKRINNLPLYLMLTILPYLDHETRTMIQKYVPIIQNQNEQFLKLISLSQFVSKYITSTDRSIYLSFYTEPAFIKYETGLIGEISERNPQKYFRIQKQLEQLLQQMKQQIKCLESGQALVQMIQLQIKDPELPMPRMRKQGIAMHCNSQLQYALVDLNFEGASNEDQFVEDCVLDLAQLISCLEGSLNDLLQQKLRIQCRQKPVLWRIKQCYYHPQVINLQNYRNYLIKQLIPFNLFVYLHALIAGVAQMYQQYILDQDKQFQRFIQFQMRYCIYRSTVVALEQSQIPKILYNSVHKLLTTAGSIFQQKIKEEKVLVIVEKQTIIEAPVQLENKRSGDEDDNQVSELIVVHRVSKVQSEVRTQKSAEDLKDIDIQMTSRLYMASGKIWINQKRRLKRLLQQNPSPSKFLPGLSQENINNKCFMKILNRLSYINILDRLQKQIFDLAQPQCFKQLGNSSPLRDQDIANIFRSPTQNFDLDSPTHGTTSISQSSPQSPHSPYSPYGSSFSSMVRNPSNESCTYEVVLKAIENKLRTQPYRFQKNREMSYNQSSSISPDKQKDNGIMPQVDLQNLRKLPSLRHNKLLSKVSMVSKFTKFTDARAVSNVEQLIQQDIGIQQQILTQYNAYLMDLSVNEITVNWCGHSLQHLMGEYYNSLEQYLLKYNEGFICYLMKIGEEACQRIQQSNKKCHAHNTNAKCVNIVNKVLKQMVQWHLQYMDIGLICKRTLAKIIKTANEWIMKICSRYKIEESEIELIGIKFDEIDKMIEHYNQKMWKIQKNVPEPKLKIYEERKSIRNVIHLIKSKQNDHSSKQKYYQNKKPERKRRNSQQALILHKIE